MHTPKSSSPLALWLPLGVAVGCALGVSLGNLAAGVGVGCALGVLLGFGLPALMRQRRS